MENACGVRLPTGTRPQVEAIQVLGVQIRDQLPGSSCEPERCSPFEEELGIDCSVSTSGHVH